MDLSRLWVASFRPPICHLRLVVVGDNDQPIGEFSKDEVWKKRLRNRIVRIMVEDEQGCILLQKRSKGKSVTLCHNQKLGGTSDTYGSL